MIRAGLLALLVACGGGIDSPLLPDGPAGADGNPGDAGDACATNIGFLPQEPVANVDTRVFAEAIVTNAPGVQTFQWTVLRGATPIAFDLASDDRVITFSGAQAGTYDVYMRVDVPGSLFCPEASVSIEVKTPGAGQAELRLHAVAPDSQGLPPINSRVLVDGGDTDSLPELVLSDGLGASGMVVDNASTPIAAYMKFMPRTGGDAFVEAFSGPSGQYGAMLRPEQHDVLVVPISSALAPRIVLWQPGMTQLAVDGGTVITGVVRDGSNALMPGAKVQLTVDGVPSTLDTTAANGRFTVRAATVAGASITFDVLPPASLGLPRLIATSTTFNIGQDVQVQFASVTTRDLAGSVVRRGGTPVPNAQLSVVGTLGNAGTIGGVTAAGEIRLGATANASGVLPALRAPALALSAVVEAAPGDFAVSALDLTGGVPASINAPAMIAVTTLIRDPDGNLAPGVTLDLIPRTALQLAGTPAVRVTAASDGRITTSLAANGRYDLRYTDPGARGAQRVTPNFDAGPLPATTTLLTATKVTVRVRDGANFIPGVVTQFRCPDCTGVDRYRSIAEGVTGTDGRVVLAVPRP